MPAESQRSALDCSSNREKASRWRVLRSGYVYARNALKEVSCVASSCSISSTVDVLSSLLLTRINHGINLLTISIMISDDISCDVTITAIIIIKKKSLMAEQTPATDNPSEAGVIRHGAATIPLPQPSAWHPAADSVYGQRASATSISRPRSRHGETCFRHSPPIY